MSVYVLSRETGKDKLILTSDTSHASVNFTPTTDSFNFSIYEITSLCVFDSWKACSWSFDKMAFLGTWYDMLTEQRTVGRIVENLLCLLVLVAMPTPETALRASLEKHNEIFERLLKLIPAQYYILNEEQDEQVKFQLVLYHPPFITCSLH